MISETSTLWISLTSDVHSLVVIGLVLSVLLGLDFIRRIFMFGKH